HRASVVRLAELLEPQIAAYLDEQKGRVIKAITGSRSSVLTNTRPVNTRAIEELDWDRAADELLRILQAWRDSGGAAAFKEASTLIGQEIAWDVSDPFIAELHRILGHRVRDITETTRSDIERVVTEALTEGTTLPDLAEKLTGLYDETYRGRSMTIARTESQV